MKPRQWPELVEVLINLCKSILGTNVIFWFNIDSRLSIPSVSIPYGQRFVTITLQSQANMVFAAPGNLFLELEVQTQESAIGGAGGTPAALDVFRVNTWTTVCPVMALNSNIDTTQTISSFSLYINNIFVNPEINACVDARKSL
jgi:hypothetical protein